MFLFTKNFNGSVTNFLRYRRYTVPGNSEETTNREVDLIILHL